MKYRRNGFVEPIGDGTKGKLGIHPSPWIYEQKK
jgi:hypothetical protein